MPESVLLGMRVKCAVDERDGEKVAKRKVAENMMNEFRGECDEGGH